MTYGGTPDLPPDDGTADARDQLLTALAHLREEERRLASLTEAQQKAMEKSWGLPDRVRTAEAELKRVREAETSRLAYEFASAGTITATSPISNAQLALEQAQAEHEQIHRVRAALDHELAQCDSRLNTTRHMVWAALAGLVCASAEFAQLVRQHRAAWQRLRTVKQTLRVVRTACHGYLPKAFEDEIDIAEPLEIRVGYGVDDGFVEAWRSALETLQLDPDTDLPKA
jgi:DNA repair ATPase RecN